MGLSTPHAEILELFRRTDRFLLCGHEHPDGDCLGSEVGLFHLLRALGKDVQILNPDPPTAGVTFLCADTPIGSYRDTRVVPECDLVVLLDCAELSRLGELGTVIRDRGTQVAVIDHHVGSDRGDGTVCAVDVSAAATGVIVHDLYQQLGVPVGTVAATGLFVSIVADTGWFKYSNTDPRALHIAAALVDAGVRPDVLYDRIYRDNDPRSIALLVESLATHEQRLGGRFGYAVLTSDLLARLSRSGFDTDGILEPVRSIRGVEVAGLFKDLGNGVVKMSLRSMGEVDVQAIAAQLGGGGHTKAAGASLRMAVDEAIDRVESILRAQLGELAR